MTYLPALDGIRAIAILAVLIFHAWPAALRGGFTGVDVFFVLSGFLITSIILAPMHGGKFSFREFYLRRIQRLLPNLALTVLAVVLAWTLLLPPGLANQPARHGLWTLPNLSNFYVWRDLGGYWGDNASWAPLTHTWSLGIEEQFYLLFPVTLWLLARWQQRRVGLWLLVATLLSLTFCVLRSRSHAASAFYLLPTRVWELLLGATLAAVSQKNAEVVPKKFREATALLGLASILIGYVLIDERTVFPGTAALLPTLGTALLIASVISGPTWLSRWLSTSPMVGIGKVSYSLYLWHWPAIIFGKLQGELWNWPPWLGTGATGGVLLGWLAYLGIERPLRRRDAGRSRRLVIIATGFGAAVLACGFVMPRTANVDPTGRFDRLSFSGKLYDTGDIAAGTFAKAVRYADVDFRTPPTGNVGAWRNGGIIHRHGADQPQVVVLGSSHALMYSRLIDDLCRERKFSVAFLAMDNGAPAFFETRSSAAFSTAAEADEFDATRRKWLREWRPQIVFVIDRWDARVETKSTPFEARLRDFLREVSPLTQRVVMVTQVPVASLGEKFNLRGVATWHLRFVRELPRILPDANEPLRQVAASAAEKARAEFANLQVLRADRLFYQPDGSIRYVAGRKFFYADDDHLSDAGSDEVRALFQRAF